MPIANSYTVVYRLYHPGCYKLIFHCIWIWQWFYTILHWYTTVNSGISAVKFLNISSNVAWSVLSNLGRFHDLLSYENSFHLKRKPVDNKSAKKMKVVHHYDTQNNKLNHPGFSFSIQAWWPFCTSTFVCGSPLLHHFVLSSAFKCDDLSAHKHLSMYTLHHTAVYPWFIFNIQVWWPFCTWTFVSTPPHPKKCQEKSIIIGSDIHTLPYFNHLGNSMSLPSKKI